MSAARLLRRRGIARARRGVVPALQFHPLRGHSMDRAVVDDPIEAFRGIDRSVSPDPLWSREAREPAVYFTTEPEFGYPTPIFLDVPPRNSKTITIDTIREMARIIGG